MWLPETAVDLESLSIMAQQGIAFTILSPHQASRIRPSAQDSWRDVGDGSIDPRRPYLQRLPHGRSMAIFFYDGPISRDIAFGDLLNDGRSLAGRLMESFEGDRDEDQLVHIATDGETFGHHHRFGDMALAFALETVDAHEAVRLTNYAEFLANRSPSWEVEIKENTAWSCAHGVARWTSDCGCHSGRKQEWNQGWRAPLRSALDWLRDTLAEVYTEHTGRLFVDPWQARNDYIEVILDRSPETIDRFLTRHQAFPLDETSRRRALKLLEMQRQALLMYTSCGWFFDELSGIETVQVIQYAGRAVQLALELADTDIEGPFLEKLALAQSNLPKHKNGRHIYEKWVRPASVDLSKTAAHYAISALFEDYPEAVSIFCYSIENLDKRVAEAGKAKITTGRARITSRITRETDQFHYAVFSMGDHNISCGIQRFDETEYPRMAEDLLNIFQRGDFPTLFQRLGNYFPDVLYSLASLFRDEKRKVLNAILTSSQADALLMYRQLYDNHVSLMRFINNGKTMIPKTLYVAGELVINSDLNAEFSREELRYDTIGKLIDDAERAGIELDATTLEYGLRHHLEWLARNLLAHPQDFGWLQRLAKGVEMAVELPFPVRFQQVQNHYYQLGLEFYPVMREKADAGDNVARQWTATFLSLASMLKIRIT
jgi:hypothetical protein